VTALDELNKLKGIIDKKYKEFLTRKEYSNLLKKITIVDNELKQKIFNIGIQHLMYDNHYEQDMEEEKHKTR